MTRRSLTASTASSTCATAAWTTSSKHGHNPTNNGANDMKTLATIIALLGGLLLAVPGARAHCDAVDGPGASAAVKALDMKNVNLVLPYLPAASEGELTA